MIYEYGFILRIEALSILRIHRKIDLKRDPCDPGGGLFDLSKAMNDTDSFSCNHDCCFGSLFVRQS